MKARRLLVCLAALLLGSLAATPASASPAALDGRGLPRLLAVDESNLGRFPGSAVWFTPRLLLDSGGTVLVQTGNYFHYESDDLNLALAGGSWRGGILMEGDRRNVLVGAPGGWGLVLGYQETYTRQENSAGSEESLNRWRERDRELSVRAGLGRSWRGAGGRVFELGVAGIAYDAYGDFEGLSAQATEVSLFELDWHSHRGLGGEAMMHCVSPHPGLQIAGTFAYSELHPRSTQVQGLRVRRRSAEMDVGWRLQPRGIDDIVVGITGAWSVDDELSLSGYSATSVDVVRTSDTVYRGTVFASVEEVVNDEWVVRGGVTGPADFTVHETEESYLFANEPRSQAGTRVSDGAARDPTLVLGVGWTWRALQLDAHLKSDVDLTDPFARWSARLEW
jgi:hypothetical protein